MAYTEGNTYPANARGDLRRMGILACSCVLLAVLLAAYSDWGTVPAVLLGAASCAMLLAGYFRMHPLSRARIFRRDEYARLLAADDRMRGALSRLDDTHFVLSNIMVELFHVEHLVVSRGGIFVIAAVPGNGQPALSGSALFAGGRSLEPKTAALWRACHFFNMIIQKSYRSQVMPRPVLVFTDLESVPFGEFDGISIVTPDGLLPAIMSVRTDALSKELCDSIAYYLKSRYIEAGSADDLPDRNRNG